METALNRVRGFHRPIGAPVAEGPELLACQRAAQSAKCKMGSTKCRWWSGEPVSCCLAFV